jgi:hypothetical protein
MQAPFDQNMMDFIDPFHRIHPVAPPPSTRRSSRSPRESRHGHRRSHRGSRRSHRGSRRSPPPMVDTRTSIQRRMDEMRVRMEQQYIRSQYAESRQRNFILQFFRWLMYGNVR